MRAELYRCGRSAHVLTDTGKGVAAMLTKDDDQAIADEALRWAYDGLLDEPAREDALAVAAFEAGARWAIERERSSERPCTIDPATNPAGGRVAPGELSTEG